MGVAAEVDTFRDVVRIERKVDAVDDETANARLGSERVGHWEGKVCGTRVEVTVQVSLARRFVRAGTRHRAG